MQSVKICENCDKFVVAPSHWTKASLTTYQKRSRNIMRLGSFYDYTPVYVMVKSQGYIFFPKGKRIVKKISEQPSYTAKSLINLTMYGNT